MSADSLSLSTRWPIIGHDLAVAQLQRAVERGQVAHAYLFTGPAQVGKKTLALALAQALLCASEGSRPCGACRACRLVQARRHPDFLTLDMAWQTTRLAQKGEAQSISVDAVRLMNNELMLRPHEGKWKILLVPDVHELTTAAANAFLKTLEEPPPFVVILLTSRDSELVLPTIRSRCQPLPLLPLPVAQVEKTLINQYNVETGRARLIARISGGRIGWALRALEEARILEQRQEALESLEQAMVANRALRLLQASALSKERDVGILLVWASWWRDLLLVQNNADSGVNNIDQLPALQAAAKRYTMEQVRSFLSELQRLLHVALETNVNRQLLWEVLMLKMPYPAH
jgi:DNA polymerase III subunit delta'